MIGLLEPEKEFIEDQINELRKCLSGVKITHPFGLETVSISSPITGFSGVFDTFVFELPPAEEVFGLASVDGFREFHNTVYLTIIESGEIVEASKDFEIHDTSLLKKITEAKHYDKKIHYIAHKIFEKRPDKPTFIHKSIKILD